VKKTSKRASQLTRARRRAVEPLRAHYDFGAGVRGRYAKRVPPGTYLVLLDPDLARAFKSETAVNRALRQYLRDRSKQ
jgi:hypothetical protein